MSQAPATAELYPEHTKLRTIAHLSQAQADFVEWLSDRGIYLAEGIGHGDLYRIHKSLRALLAEYHEIDEARLETEKRAMLAELRTAHEVAPVEQSS